MKTLSHELLRRFLAEGFEVRLKDAISLTIEAGIAEVEYFQDRDKTIRVAEKFKITEGLGDKYG